MTRIAVGGFLHETNTFAPTKATYDAFVHGGGWPSMALGTDVLKVMRKINVGLAGFVDAADDNGWELVPTISCAASPSAHVTKDAFERVVKVMVEGIASAGAEALRVLPRQPVDLVLRVADTGPGLDPERAGDAFHRGWSTKNGGRGIGLALVGQAVRRNRGTIEVGTDGGAVFTVRLPVRA